MSPATAAALTGVLIFACAVWLGGLVAIAVVARVATATLDAKARVAFFRRLGRTYGILGTSALAVCYGTGAALVYGRTWDGALIATTVVATGLAISLAVGVTQARRMTRLRREALERPSDEDMASQVRKGAIRAGALRGVIVLLSLALLSLGTVLGS